MNSYRKSALDNLMKQDIQGNDLRPRDDLGDDPDYLPDLKLRLFRNKEKR